MAEHLRNKRVDRTLKLVAALLRGTPLTRQSAAQVMGVQPQTAYRQLRAVAEALPAVEWEKNRSPKTLVFDRRKLTDPPDHPSAVAACFALSLAPLFNGAAQEAGIKRAFQYVLGQSYRRKVFKDIDRKFTFVRQGGEIALPQNGPLLDELIEAVLQSKRVRLKYGRFGGDVGSAIVKPLSLCIYDHQLYVVGEDRKRRRHPYRFSRIRSVETLATFDYPSKAEYDPTQLFMDSFGIFVDERNPIELVELHLDDTWHSHAMSHLWHPSQRVERLDNGKVRLTLSVRVCPQVRAWVLGFGGEAEVVSPKALRREIAEMHAAACARYAGRER